MGDFKAPPADGFMYLGSPYSAKDPLVREMRFLEAAEAMRCLLANGIWVYSPIVHCHQLAQIWGLPTDHTFWKQYDNAMISASRGMFVLKLPGWANSLGLKAEIAYAIEIKKSITYLSPGDVLNAAYTYRPNQGPIQPPAEAV
jgi:hypothetical protein